jgi:hypothetical protein
MAGVTQNGYKATTGRPSEYTKEQGDAICSQLAGGISLKRVCEQKGMPSRQTVYTWLRTYPEFLDNYTRAKDDGADAYADDIADIAERVISPNKKLRLDPNAARVAIEGKKWAASKLKPKKYGDKLDVTTDGKELPAPIFGGMSVSTNGTPANS